MFVQYRVRVIHGPAPWPRQHGTRNPLHLGPRPLAEGVTSSTDHLTSGVCCGFGIDHFACGVCCASTIDIHHYRHGDIGLGHPARGVCCAIIIGTDHLARGVCANFGFDNLAFGVSFSHISTIWQHNTADSKFLSLSIEHLKYSVITWVLSIGPYAYGPGNLS